MGGEWGGAVLMAVEHGHRGRRGLYASWVQAGVPAGLLLATAVFNLCSLLPEEAFLSWGWRVPFLLGIALLGVGMFIRLRVLESPLFAQIQRSEAGRCACRSLKLSAATRATCCWRWARGSPRTGVSTSSRSSCSTYATVELGLAKTTILNGVLVASAVQFFVIPVFGILSDRVGRRPVYLGGAVALAVFAFPFFWMVDTGSTPMIWLAIIDRTDRARGHVRAAGGFLFRAIRHRGSLFRRIDRLPARLAPGRWSCAVDRHGAAAMERRPAVARCRLLDGAGGGDRRFRVARRRDTSCRA